MATGVLLEPQGNQRDTLKTPQSDPRPNTYTHTHTHQYTWIPSDTTVKQPRLNRMHNYSNTDRPHYTPKSVGTHTQPSGHPNIPGRSAHLPNSQHSCAHILHPQTHRYTHSEIQRNRPTAAANHVRTHTSGYQKHRQPSEGATCAHIPPREHTVTILRPTNSGYPAHRRCPPQELRLGYRDPFPHVPPGLG